MITLDTSWWVDLIAVLVLLFIAFTAAIKQKTSIPYGAFAIVIAFYLGVMTFTTLSPLWTIGVMLIVATLYAIGLRKADHNDDAWHFGALLVAVSGKGIVALFVATADAMVPFWAMLLPTLLLVGLIIGIIFLFRSQRIQRWLNAKFSQVPTDKTPPVTTS